MSREVIELPDEPGYVRPQPREEKPEIHAVDFVAISTPLIERGFRVTVADPESKMGVLRNWQDFQFTDVGMLKKWIAKNPKYRHDNNAVVGKRGVGRHCFLDIDAEGVLERIERETGQKMPLTYAVQTRPQTAPHKRHYYFRQTEESFAAFAEFADSDDPWASKNLNIKDLFSLERSKKGKLLHPTLYDLKGVGGGSLVVGAGSVRPYEIGKPREYYTHFQGEEVLDMPSWLLKWFIQDIRKYRAAVAKEKAEKLVQKSLERAKYSTAKRAAFRAKGDPRGFDICEEDIPAFARWRAGSLASLGAEAEAIEITLTGMVKYFCEGGEEFVISEGGRAKIHDIAFNPKLIKGVPSLFYRRGRKYREPVASVPVAIDAPVRGKNKHAQADIIASPKPHGRPTKLRNKLMVEIIKTLPDTLSVADAYDRLEQGLAKKDVEFDRSERVAIQRARQQAGFKVDREARVWRRVGTAG